MTDWEAVDWTLSNAEIARRIGVSRERVRVVRARRGIPKPTPTSAAYRASQMDLSQFTVREAAKELGITEQSTRRIGNMLGLKFKPADRVLLDWSGADWSQPNAVIAEALSLPYATVARRRSELRRAGVDVPSSPRI